MQNENAPETAAIILMALRWQIEEMLSVVAEDIPEEKEIKKMIDRIVRTDSNDAQSCVTVIASENPHHTVHNLNQIIEWILEPIKYIISREDENETTGSN